MEEEVGLLGRITGGLRGLLDNPFVQGVGGALAFGANPALGLLAGVGLKNSRERRELNNEALRTQITSANRRSDALDQLPGLLAQRTPIDRLLDVEGGASTPIQSATPGGSIPFTATQPGQAQLQGLLARISPQAGS